ncbi:hypothetical protein EJB05_29370, partial [Eragrostis curvula]
MGVPSFYKWLVGKYPNIVVPAREDDSDAGEGPGNGVYHNLYLDMNGIIHPCLTASTRRTRHSRVEIQQVCPPTTFDEVFQAMFEYMDRLDLPHRQANQAALPGCRLNPFLYGVAPRAKMNQQRSRRFKAAKDAKDAAIEEKLLREKFTAQGKEVLPRETNEVSDPNVITPGTEFMEKLSTALEYYIRARLNSDPGWKDIKVILSDSNVPGEGEHKIMSFIRAQRSCENYDPKTRHCLHNQKSDADLIMLALASHEPHFSILREDVLEIQPENCIPLAKEFVKTEESSRKYRGWFPRAIEGRIRGKTPNKSYQFLNIWVLREYLELDLKILNPIFKTDVEKLVDDFIFICFLTGNDFIPHIPSLEIREDAVDLLIEVYKTNFNKMGGYIVNTKKVTEKHAAYLKSYQRKILCQAAEKDWNEKLFDDAARIGYNFKNLKKILMVQTYWSSLLKHNVLFPPAAPTSQMYGRITANTLELRQNLKDALRKKQDLVKSGASNHDKIRLGFAGWKSRFYREKFGIENYNEVGKLKNNMVQKYLEGLCWVLQYYFADVPSWSWYGIAMLPFIDEKLLLSATKTVENNLAMHEMSRNTARQEKIFLQNSNTLASHAASTQTSDCSSRKLQIDPSISELRGWLSSAEDNDMSSGLFHSPVKDLEDIINDQTISFLFFNPETTKPIPRLLDNVNIPEKVNSLKTLTEDDISRKPLWHTYPGNRSPVTTAAMAVPPRINSFSRWRGNAITAKTPHWSDELCGSLFPLLKELCGHCSIAGKNRMHV